MRSLTQMPVGASRPFPIEARENCAPRGRKFTNLSSSQGWRPISGYGVDTYTARCKPANPHDGMSPEHYCSLSVDSILLYRRPIR